MLPSKPFAVIVIVVLMACTNREQKNDEPTQKDNAVINVEANLADLPPPPPVDPNEPPPPPPPPGSNPPTPDSMYVYLPETKMKFAEEPFVVVEQQPEFPGGMAELGKHFNKNTFIPKNCRQGFTGRLFFDFVVTKVGEVKNVRMHKICGSIKHNEEILSNIFKNMPRWKPGKQNGKPVDVKFSLPMCILLSSQ